MKRPRPTRIALPWLLAILLPLQACSGAPTRSDPDMPAHHTDQGFRNQYIQPHKGTIFTYIRMRYFGDEEWPDYQRDSHQVPRVETAVARLHHPGDTPQVTWIGHATVLVQVAGINILTDPIFSERASPLSFMGPKRAVPPSITLAQLPPIDFVLISHNHYDHLDAATVEALGDRTTWLVPLGHKEWFNEHGVNRVIEFDWWDEQRIATDPVAIVTAAPSQHWSGRGLFDRYQSLWASWSVAIGGFKFWFAGDTGYNDKTFTEIGNRLGPFDLALIPIGGYDPRWFMQATHVNPEEAVQLHREIRSRYSVGIHWGVFPLTAEPIDEPPLRLRRAAEALQGTKFVVFPIGKTEEVPAGTKESGPVAAGH